MTVRRRTISAASSTMRASAMPDSSAAQAAVLGTPSVAPRR